MSTVAPLIFVLLAAAAMIWFAWRWRAPTPSQASENRRRATRTLFYFYTVWTSLFVIALLLGIAEWEWFYLGGFALNAFLIRFWYRLWKQSESEIAGDVAKQSTASKS